MPTGDASSLSDPRQSPLVSDSETPRRCSSASDGESLSRRCSTASNDDTLGELRASHRASFVRTSSDPKVVAQQDVEPLEFWSIQ